VSAFVTVVDEALIIAGCEPIFQKSATKPTNKESESKKVPADVSQDGEDYVEYDDEDDDFGIRIEFEPNRVGHVSSESKEDDLLREFCNS